MTLEIAGRQYETIRGSDVVNDGMFLELWDITEAPGAVVLFAFWSDADGGFTFSAHTDKLPFELVEIFVQDARRLLPPKQDAA